MFLLFLFFAVAFANHNQHVHYAYHPEISQAGFLGLASEASSVVPNIQTGFSCVGKAYGYYADVENNCQIYHVCQQSVNAKGEPTIYHYSYYCPANTRFDQRKLVCIPVDDVEILKCEDSHNFFPVTESKFKGFYEPPQPLVQMPVQREFNQEEVVRNEQFGTKSIGQVKGKQIVQPPVKSIVQTPVVHSVKGKTNYNTKTAVHNVSNVKTHVHHRHSVVNYVRPAQHVPHLVPVVERTVQQPFEQQSWVEERQVVQRAIVQTKDEPVVQVPIVQAPVKELPVVQAPVKEMPVVQTPLVQTPVKEVPKVVQTPVHEVGVLKSPVVHAKQEPIMQNRHEVHQTSVQSPVVKHQAIVNEQNPVETNVNSNVNVPNTYISPNVHVHRNVNV